jgi:hypothetical protein
MKRRKQMEEADQERRKQTQGSGEKFRTTVPSKKPKDLMTKSNFPLEYDNNNTNNKALTWMKRRKQLEKADHERRTQTKKNLKKNSDIAVLRGRPKN